MDTPLPIFGVNTGWHVSRIAKRILAGCAVYLPALIYSFGKYGFFFTYPLASLRNRNRKAYAVVRTCPYTRAPVSRSTKCVSLPVMPGSRPDNRYARRVDRQICVWITHKFITTSSERMLAFTGEWYRGLMPTLGGGGAPGRWDLPSNGFVKFRTLFVVKRDSTHTSRRVSDCTVTLIPSKQIHVPKLLAKALHSADMFWELARQVIRELAHAWFADTVEGLRGRQPS